MCSQRHKICNPSIGMYVGVGNEAFIIIHICWQKVCFLLYSFGSLSLCYIKSYSKNAKIFDRQNTKRNKKTCMIFSMLKTLLTTKIPVEKCKLIAVHVHYDSLASCIHEYLSGCCVDLVFICLGRSLTENKLKLRIHQQTEKCWWHKVLFERIETIETEKKIATNIK